MFVDFNGSTGFDYGGRIKFQGILEVVGDGAEVYLKG